MILLSLIFFFSTDHSRLRDESHDALARYVAYRLCESRKKGELLRYLIDVDNRSQIAQDFFFF